MKSEPAHPGMRGAQGGRATPLVPIRASADGNEHRIWLKLESENPSGSVKFRTAKHLIRGLIRNGGLEPGQTVVESTSGNLGVAMAYLAYIGGWRFHAVVDPKSPPYYLKRMAQLGAVIDMVRDADPHGNYLAARIKRVTELEGSSDLYVWPNQYENSDNPHAHATETGPELIEQSEGQVDAVFVAVSTGGTLAGIATYLRKHAPHVKVIGVDAQGSAVFTGCTGPRLLTGIGSNQRSRFIEDWMFDHYLIVADEEAFATCWKLNLANVSVGGSGGAVVSACARFLRLHEEIRYPLCICADGRAPYTHTILDQRWLAEHGIRDHAGQPSFQLERCDSPLVLVRH